MRDGPAILIDKAWAKLMGWSAQPLSECLTVMDPKRFFNAAFKQKRWDGKIHLFEGTRFPAGLTQRVIDHFASKGIRAVIRGWEPPETDVSEFTKDYFTCLGPKKDGSLWDHQCEAIRQMLTHPRGVIKSPTASGKTPMIAAVAQYLWFAHGYRSIVVVPRKGLAEQTTRFLRDIFGEDISVGQCGDGLKEIGTVTVATAQTLIGFRPRERKKKGGGTYYLPADPELRKIIDTYEVLILDETHHVPSDTWYEIAMASVAFRRYGLSGTPLKNDELADLRMIGATGPILYSVDPQELIDLQIAAKPKIVFVCSEAASEPELPDVWETNVDERTGKLSKTSRSMNYAEAYSAGIVNSDIHNRSVVWSVLWLVDHGRRTLVLCRRKSHFIRLKETLERLLDADEFAAVWGATEMDERLEAKADLNDSRIKVILATTIFDEGEDIPGVEAIVLAEGVKVPTNAIQRIGRGMRRKEGVAADLWVVDFGPLCHQKLLEHALAREKAYLGEGYEVLEWGKDWPVVGELPGGISEFSFYDDDHLLPFERWDEYIESAEEYV
jgi:superfamily II DNA or RNA helicase